MAEESGAPNLVSAPIIPSLPEIEAGKNPFGSLHTPSPVIMPFGSLMPIVPNGVPRNIDVNTQLQGDFQSGPTPGAKPVNTQGGTLDYVKAVSDYMKDDKAVQDRYKYGRTYSYGAGYKNSNFDRYYEHGKFKELGFSPYRDNEALYNERSSWWDDFNRMSGQWGGLAWSGFKSIWGDEAEAHETMDKGMAIGQTTRGGFGGWVTNFSLNSAYTVGVMSEIILEDLALLALEGLSGGTASGVVIPTAIARNSIAFGRLAKAWGGMHKFMSGLKTVDQVKDFYNAGKTWDRTVDFAKWLNPAQRSMDFLGDVVRGTKGLDNLGTMAKVTKGFGQFYRDFRELNVALSESFLEGESASTNYQQQLLDEFYAQNGRMPEGLEAEEIYQKGQSIKSTVSLANAATIYYSNKLVFEDLFEGFRPGSKVADLFLEGTGRYLKRAPAQTFKAGVTGAVQAGTKTGLQKTRDFLIKSPYLPWSKKYFVGNLGEALQESAQEVIQVSALDYYDKISKDPTQAHFYSALASIGKGTSEQFSAQGLDTFLQGYLMGSLIQGTGAAGKNIMQKITDRSAEAKVQGEKTDNDILNAANHIADNALIFGDHNVSMASAVKVANEQKRRSIDQGDEKTANDMTDELQIQYFHTLARSKNMGLVTGHINDMLSLNDEDLAQAYNLSQNQADDIRKKLMTLKDRADGYQRKYDHVQRRLPNTANPWMFNPKTNKAAYDNEMDKYIAHETAVSNLLFATEDYERITGRMNNIGKNLSGQGNLLQNLVNVIKGGTQVANAAAADVSLLVDHVQRTMTMQSLKDQISVLNQGTAQQKKEAEGLSEQLELLQEWNQLADHYVREMKSDRKAQFSAEEATLRDKISRVRAGAGVVDKKGQEYTVDSVKGDMAIVRTKDGQIKRIKRKNLDVTKEAKRGEFEAIEGDDLSFAISELYDTYKKYIGTVAKIKKGFVFDDQLNEAFKQIKDYYQLEQDAARMVHTINTLSDPEYFSRYREIETRIAGLQRERRLANLQEALNKFKDMIGQNSFLNEIYDLGVFVLPEDVEALKDYKVVDFYNQVSKNLVPRDSELYGKIMEVIEKYSGKPIKEEVVEEPSAEPEIDIPAKEAGLGILGDRDLVTNATPVEILKTSIQGVALLKDLVDSYKNYRREQELPEVSMEFDQIITTDGFKTFMAESGTASSIIESFNDKRRGTPVVPKKKPVNIWAPGNKKIFTGIDAGGVQHTEIPIEITEYSEYVDSDTKTQVKEVVARNMNTGDMVLLDLNSDNAKDFKYSAITADVTFAKDIIPEEVYQDFVNTGKVPMNILEAIAQKIKTHTTLSPYETAIFNDTAQTKIINEILITEANAVPREHKGVMVIEDLQIKAATGEPGAAKYDRTAKVIKINPVLMRQKFDEKAWTKPRKQRDGSFSESLPENTFVTYEQFEDFVIEHEYQHTQLTFGQFQAANPDSTYGLYEDFINDRALLEIGLLQEEDSPVDIMTSYNKINGRADLNKWKEDALEVVSSSTLRDKLSADLGVNFNSDYVKKLVADKERDLAMNLTFESLTPGTVVLMKNNKVMVVRSITDKEVTLVTPEAYRTNDPTAGTTIIAAGAIASQIKMRHSEFMDKAEKEAALTPQEVEDSKAAVDNAKDIDDPEKMAREIEESLEKKPEQLDDELGDAINNCKIKPE